MERADAMRRIGGMQRAETMSGGTMERVHPMERARGLHRAETMSGGAMERAHPMGLAGGLQRAETMMDAGAMERNALMERAKSEGASPIGSPSKWKEEIVGELMDERRGRGGGRQTRAMVERRGSDAVLSSDDESYVDMTNMAAGRPRQRSLRRRKIGFTNNLTSEQLVTDTMTALCVPTCTRGHTHTTSNTHT